MRNKNDDDMNDENMYMEVSSDFRRQMYLFHDMQSNYQ